MNEKILKYLYDVKLAIDEIDSFFIDNEKQLSFEGARRAEENFEIKMQPILITLKII